MLVENVDAKILAPLGAKYCLTADYPRFSSSVNSDIV
jgi:hypothetical protein